MQNEKFEKNMCKILQKNVKFKKNISETFWTLSLSLACIFNVKDLHIFQSLARHDGMGY